MTALEKDSARRCVVHDCNCDIAPGADAFGAGFSCTSYSALNKDAAKNATAMEKARQAKPEPGGKDEESSVSELIKYLRVTLTPSHVVRDIRHSKYSHSRYVVIDVIYITYIYIYIISCYQINNVWPMAYGPRLCRIICPVVFVIEIL